MNNRLWTLPFIILLAACQPQTSPSVPPTLEASVTPPQPEQTETVPPATDIPLPSVYRSIQVAYTAQEQLWLWENGGSIPLTSANPDTPPVFSASGDQIAFIRDGELLVIHSDGSSERVLIPAQEMTAIEPQNPARLVQFSWVGGKPLLLVSTLEDSGIGLQPNQDLYILHTDTDEIVPIFPAGQGGLAYPSPDGAWLAVVSKERALLMKSDGSEEKARLTYSPYQSGHFPYIPKPYWAGDSLFFLLEVWSEEFITIWKIPVEGEPSIPYETSMYRGLSFSPDLSRFAYILDDGMLDSPIELHIANLDGTDDMVYARATHEDYTGLGFLGWAPNSQSFLFTDTGGMIQWMKTGESEAQAVPMPPVEPLRAIKILWLDAGQFVIIIRSPSGIWLSAPGQESLQIAGFSEGDFVASDLARSFDIALMENFLP